MPDETRERPPLPLRLSMYCVVMAILMLAAVRWLNAASLYPGVGADASIGPATAVKTADVREVHFTTEDGVRLYGWVQGPDSASRKIIQFMGNGEFVGPAAKLYADTAKALDAQFLLFDYRGFANSEGEPSERGLYADARAAWKFATIELGWKRIIIWGRSLGGAPAIKLTTELIEAGTPPAALILESPFASIRAMAKAKMAHLGKPEWLIYESYDNLSRAPALTLPVFHLHSVLDEVIPYQQAEDLHEALPGPKELLTLGAVGHNDTWDDPSRAREIREQIDAFLRRHE